MIKAGIIGGAGYTGGELIRILLGHPQCDIRFVHSRSQAGGLVSALHLDLIGETDLQFIDQVQTDVDVLFLCMGHGESSRFLAQNKIPDSIKIIDSSQDFRLESAENRPFVYGLPEAFRDQIIQADNIANPGCFATAIQLSLLPLSAKQLLNEDVQVSGITGSTGAGQSPSTTTHLSWRSSNVSLYKAFNHQHLAEINQTLKILQPGWNSSHNFVPIRGNFTRGILIAAYTKTELDFDQAKQLYQEFYSEHPFVFLSADNPDVKQVLNTNKCVLHLEKHGDILLAISVIDNLVKGASGQAIQNMNLMFGLDEHSGLRLKPTAF